MGWLAVCWLIYATAYLARANISSGFAELSAHFGVDDAYLGMMGSLFFICYSVGQLINGYVGDHIAPQKFVLFSMVATSILYALVSILNDAHALLILWGINGFFLSMLWGPMLRLLCMRLGQERKADIAMLMGAAPVGGYFLSWMVLGPRLSEIGWAGVLGIPMGLTLILLAVWALMTGRKTEQVCPEWAQKRRGLRETFQYVKRKRLWSIALSSICLGLVKENVALLLPVLFVGFLGEMQALDGWKLALLPLANIVGLAMGRLLAKPLSVKPVKGLLLAFSGMAVTCAALSLSLAQPILAFGCLFALVALGYFCSCIVISYIPLSHAQENMVSTLVGLFDFGNYLGAGLSGAVLGVLLSQGKWSVVAVIWLLFCLAAVCLTGGYLWQAGKKAKAEVKNHGV